MPSAIYETMSATKYTYTRVGATGTAGQTPDGGGLTCSPSHTARDDHCRIHSKKIFKVHIPIICIPVHTV